MWDYLFELRESYRGTYTHFYLNHDSVSEREIGNTFGKFINHSSIHANIGIKVFVIDEGELDVLFYSLRKIKVGKQLLWYYSKNFDGVSNCMKDCFWCLKQTWNKILVWYFSVIKGLYFMFLHKGQVWFNMMVCVECALFLGVRAGVVGWGLALLCSISVHFELVKIILVL